MKTNSNEKLKRLKFAKSEDTYFLVYNVLLILFYLGAILPQKKLKDYRKLGHLIQCITNDDYYFLFKDYYKTDIIANENIKLSLKKLYLKSIENIENLKLVLLLLEDRKLITLVKESEKETNIWLNTNSELITFIESELFLEEQDKLKEILSKESRLKTITYKTFLKNLYVQNEVETWDI